MKEEIRLVIEKHLTKEVGETLRQVLEKGEQDAIRVADLTRLLDNKKSEIINLNSEIEKYKQFDDRNSKLSEREKAVDQREREAKIRELEMQLLCEQEKSRFAIDVSMGLVRNTEYRKNIYNSQSGPDGRDTYGNPTYSTHTKKLDENKEAK